MTMVAELVDAVVGGDTHKDTHTLQMMTPTGVVLGEVQIGNDPAGYRDAIGWIGRHTPGPRVIIGVEGTRSYGAGLTRALTAAGFEVLEVEQPRRADRRKGKSDPIDAHLAALAVLRMPVDRKTVPRRDGAREALRVLLVARDDIAAHRTAQINRLRALLLTGTDTDRHLGRGPMNSALLNTLTARAVPADADTETAVRSNEARRLAAGITQATTQLRDNKKQLADIVKTMAPTLQDKLGVGPVTAAQTIVSFSHPGRCRNDAAFAALAGVNPIPASSGKTTRHRLNRGGDRQLNRALHTITLTRVRQCPPPATTWKNAAHKAKPTATSTASSNATSPEKSTDTSTKPLDTHRSVNFASAAESRRFGTEVNEVNNFIRAQ